MNIFLLLDDLEVIFCFQTYIPYTTFWILHLIKWPGAHIYAFKVFNDCTEWFHSSDIQRGELQQVEVLFCFPVLHPSICAVGDGCK